MSAYFKCPHCGHTTRRGKCTNIHHCPSNQDKPVPGCDVLNCAPIRIADKAISDLQAEIEASEVSLDKFFDKVPEVNLATKASDVREMYCKLGDENERLREVIRKLHEKESRL